MSRFGWFLLYLLMASSMITGASFALQFWSSAGFGCIAMCVTVFAITTERAP